MEQIGGFMKPRNYNNHRNNFRLSMKPVLLVLIIVLSEVLSRDGQSLAASASHSSSVSHNHLDSGGIKLMKQYDPYDDDSLEDYDTNTNKETKASSRDRDIKDSSGRFRGASGRPLSTSVKDNLFDYRDNTGCPPDFKVQCRCGIDYFMKMGKKYIVNCTAAGFTSEEALRALESLPENTEVLLFTGNYMPNLTINIFGNMKTYPDLVYIDLSSNGIETILGKTFHRVNATETLILDNNHISRYTLRDHKRVFSNFVNLKYLHLSSAFEHNPDLLPDLSEVFIESNLTKLEKIHLENNGMDYINEPSVFCELSSLLDVHLSQNKFADLNLDLTCLNQVRYIDITYNDIRRVTENSGIWKLLHENNKAGKRIQVNLWHNPFECDCKLDTFIATVRNWTTHNPDVVMPYGDKLTCDDGFPKNNTGMLVREVEYTECPLLQPSDYGSTAVSMIAWVLAILFLIGIAYFIYTNQNLIWRPVSPLHQTTTQGVKYTTIQEEEAEVAHV